MGKKRKNHQPAASETFANQTISLAGIIFFVIPFAVVVIGYSLHFACSQMPETDPYVRPAGGVTVTTPVPSATPPR